MSNYRKVKVWNRTSWIANWRSWLWHRTPCTWHVLSPAHHVKLAEAITEANIKNHSKRVYLRHSLGHHQIDIAPFDIFLNKKPFEIASKKKPPTRTHTWNLAPISVPDGSQRRRFACALLNSNNSSSSNSCSISARARIVTRIRVQVWVDLDASLNNTPNANQGARRYAVCLSPVTIAWFPNLVRSRLEL